MAPWSRQLNAERRPASKGAPHAAEALKLASGPNCFLSLTLSSPWRLKKKGIKKKEGKTESFHAQVLRQQARADASHEGCGLLARRRAIWPSKCSFQLLFDEKGNQNLREIQFPAALSRHSAVTGGPQPSPADLRLPQHVPGLSLQSLAI